MTGLAFSVGASESVRQKRRRKHRPRGRLRFDTLDRSFELAGKVLSFNLGWAVPFAVLPTTDGFSVDVAQVGELLNTEFRF